MTRPDTVTYFSIWSDGWGPLGCTTLDDDMEEIIRIPVGYTSDLINKDKHLLSFIIRLSSALQAVDLYPTISQGLDCELNESEVKEIE